MKKFLSAQLLRKVITGAVLAAPLVFFVSTASHAAGIDEASVQSYAAAMKQAANSKNIAKVGSLVSDGDVIIRLNRNKIETVLDKAKYLQLLQSSWDQTTNYRYDISVSNIVISGNLAIADVYTVESWVKDGQPKTVKTSATVKLVNEDGKAKLFRAVAKVTVE
ncbi:DUF4440 domain-containing protein [Psychrobacter sp. I-STPA10]|uniref:DUF4440 domain-containing protein n=1 Tax=Psychrobacter sp. I-STPA10 TaxID=2585769 RepID=UPI001E2B5FD1|nr:DUF4440 domain-containing protein [Psychrobacter sp. I-STPA10]